MIIEDYVNILQMFISGVAVTLGLIRTVRTRMREWGLYSLFCGAYFLGDLFWTLYQHFYRTDPTTPYECDLNWCVSIMFLLMLLFVIREPRPKGKNPWFAWIGPVFTAGMAVYFMQWEDYTSNTAAAFVFGILLYQSISGLYFLRGKTGEESRNRLFYIVSIVMTLLQYLVWMLSCFWMGYTLANPYYWFDVMLSACLILMAWPVRKAVGA